MVRFQRKVLTVTIWGCCYIANSAVAQIVPAQPIEPAVQVQPSGPSQPEGVGELPAQRWTLGIGWHQYSEPLMHLDGPELTFGAKLATWRGWCSTAELHLAQLNYHSRDTGSMEGVPWVQAQWTALHTLPLVEKNTAWSIGPSLIVHWNDLRGTTSTGHRGYERSGVQVWGALQYTTEINTFEIGALVAGWQKSNLSQAGINEDIVNHQHSGLKLGVTHHLGQTSERGWRLRGQWAKISDSDQVGKGRWYEPQNTTLQLSLLKSW